MPSTVPSHVPRAYHHASDLPSHVWHALLLNEAAANVILPFAKKARDYPRESGDAQLWIALFDSANNVEFVLSCTQGPLGHYPIFIVAFKSAAWIALEEKQGKKLDDCLSPLVRCLLQEVPPQRVFSVFSIAKVTEAFAKIFVAQAHACRQYDIQAIGVPYYDATFTFCTPETLRRPAEPMSCRAWSEDVEITLCRADMSHLEGVKALCKAFSETSPPFELDDQSAEWEARMLIARRQAWVHLIRQGGREEPEIACLVAATRESDGVTAVTKVFTPEHWRGRGCAARLLHRVCQEILDRKKRVVLYVGNTDDLAPARKVYHKVGFQGLNGSREQQVRGVERWLEIGFEGTNLGHW